MSEQSATPDRLGSPPGAAVLASPARRAIIGALDAASPRGLSAQHLSTQLGLHVTTIRFHLDQLAAAGLVDTTVERPHGAGRPKNLYSMVPGALDLDVGGRAGSEDPDQAYQLLSEVLVEQLLDKEDPAAAAEQAGVRWGHRRVAERAGHDGTVPPRAARTARTAGEWLGTIGQMVDLLAEWGYQPEVTTTHAGRVAEVSMRGCPFAELVHEHGVVVCGIHKGLVRGLMEALGEGATEVSLTPFVTPTVCLASLTSTTPFVSTRSRKPHPDKEMDS